MPHVMQWFKRYRYLRHLRRVYTPAAADMSRYAAIEKQLRPNPLLIVISAGLTWLYMYPVAFGVAILLGLLRARSPVPGTVGYVEPKLTNAKTAAQEAVREGLIVQLHGASASTVARQYAATARGILWYVRVVKSRDTLGDYEQYPIQFCCMNYYLTHAQTKTMLWCIKVLFGVPVTLVLDVNDIHVDEAKLRRHAKQLVHQERLCNIVFASSAPTATTYLANQPVTPADRMAVVMTDLPATSNKSVIGATPAELTAMTASVASGVATTTSSAWLTVVDSTSSVVGWWSKAAP